MRCWVELVALALIASTAFADLPRGTTAGTLLPEAPTVAPGRITAESGSALRIARERALDGDPAGVVTALGPWLAGRKGGGRDRTAGWLLMGLAQMQLENWNLASAAFTSVRAGGGPLASYGAWYEAVVDHERGRHLAAAGRCKEYRNTWPDGPEADNCLLLMADAYAAAGQKGSAISAYRQYLDRHPDSPRQEEIRLGIALAEAVVNPSGAVPMLQDLVLTHSWHSTALAAQAALDEIGKRGLPVSLPATIDAKMRMCESARRCGAFDEAWALFQEIAALAPTDPKIAEWVERNEDRIARGTRQYDVYARSLEQQWEAKKDGELAWRIMETWGREGEWAKAVAWARKAAVEHPKHPKWSRTREEVAWAETLAGNYVDAAARWADRAKAGGAEGALARFMEPFCKLQAGDPAGAEAGFTAVLSRDRDDPRALYWRAEARDRKGDAAGAAADRETLRANDRHGWYRLLLDSASARAAAATTQGWVTRDGRWRGAARPALPEQRRSPTRPGTSAGIGRAAVAQLDAPLTSQGHAALRWPYQGAAPTASDVESAAAPATLIDLEPVDLDLPDGYGACLWFDPVTAQRDFFAFAEQHQAVWPDLPTIHDLAQAGVYEEASRLLASIFAEWEQAVEQGGDDPRTAQIRAIDVSFDDWRQFVLFARDDFNASRLCAGLSTKGASETDRASARRLAFPIVHAADLWEHGRSFGVDPLLMLGLMRQESTYKPWVVSPANAIGLVQVLPSTGARMAALLGERRYSPGDLKEPSYNLRYGTYYFSLLMKRFDGVFPLAIASYNGGPHNVSRWYKPWHDKGIALDVYVEQIPYPETRDYVKRVTGYYADYVTLYGPEGARVVLPERPLGDDAGVVDY